MGNNLTLFLITLYTLSAFSCASTKRVAHNSQDLLEKSEALVNSCFSFGEIQSLNLKCSKQVYVKQRNYQIECENKTIVDGVVYFLSNKCFEVGRNEKILFPKNVVLFDLNHRIIQQDSGCFQPPTFSNKVLFGSRKKSKFVCSHSVSFFETSDKINISKGKGILCPQDIIIINEKKDTLAYEGYYYPQSGKDEKILIACKQPTDIEIKIVPVVELPYNAHLSFKKGGKLSNGILVCKSLQISAKSIHIFDNIVLTGTIKNESLIVEWFGCNTENDGQQNSYILKQFVVPSAVACRANIFHSTKGVYNVLGSYPIINELWSFNHSFIRDFNGITVYGIGHSTKIQSCMQDKRKPSDVFNIVDSKNLRIRDLTIIHEKTNELIINGSNAISLIHSNENIQINNCSVYNLPYVHGPAYPDGGKAYTIQVGPNTCQRNILISNNLADGVAYGVDYTRNIYSKGDVLDDIVFEGNTIKNAIVGVIVHEWDSPYEDRVHPVVVKDNSISDCQIGILCQTTKSCSITNNTILNNRRPDMLSYYDGVYGIYTLGAYNTVIEGNSINLKDCDAFININVYSYYPQFNGAVKKMTVKGNKMRGTIKDRPLRIGKDYLSESEAKMFEEISISHNSINNRK